MIEVFSIDSKFNSLYVDYLFLAHFWVTIEITDSFMKHLEILWFSVFSDKIFYNIYT